MHNKNICNVLYFNYAYTFQGKAELTKGGLSSLKEDN